MRAYAEAPLGVGRAARSIHSQFLREIFGNPLRPPPSTDARRLAWNDRTVEKLVRLAYEERSLPEGTLDPHRLAVLADALEEAGCSHEDIMAHLRGPGVHVRGCWCVDALPGKE